MNTNTNTYNGKENPNRFRFLPLLVLLFMIALFFSLLSCSQDEPEPSYVSPLIESYVFEFQEHAKGFGRPSDFHGRIIVDEPSDIQEDGLIIIPIDYYNQHKDNKWAMEVYIWHELGHAILNRKDRADLNGGWPVSIMNPNKIDELIYLENLRDAYLWEMFQYPFD